MPQGLKSFKKVNLRDGERVSVLYHSIFDYPLSKKDLIRWEVGKEVFLKRTPEIVFRGGFYFLKGKKNSLAQRKRRERIAEKKMGLARRAANFLSFIPTIKMVAITGSLAMKNASEDSDIDLMIITGSGSLWITRMLSWFLLKTFGFKIRKPNLKKERNMLCLNIWLDENDLVWKKRNIFTAHEIAQTVPLINRKETHEKFLAKNLWVKDFWPNAVVKKGGGKKGGESLPLIPLLLSISGFLFFIFSFLFEPLAYFMQKMYMKKRITREVITPTRAIFHPKDWSHDVLLRLKNFQ